MSRAVRACDFVAAGLVVALCTAAAPACADDTPFDPSAAMQDTVAALEQQHFTHRPLDDALSAEWFAAFLGRLDPRRMYFQQTDVADFGSFEHRLDDLAKAADFQFARLVQRRYRERVIDAAAMARENLELEPDFAIDEEMPVRFESSARNNTELRERWRQRIKHELLIEKLHGRDLDEVKQQLLARYGRIERQAREMSDERLCQIYLDALTSRYDPRSCYFSEEYWSSFTQSISFSSHTLGLAVRQRRGRLLIQSVSHEIGSHRYADLIGWELLAIRRESGALHDVVEMHAEDYSRLIRLSTSEQVDLAIAAGLLSQTASSPLPEDALVDSDCQYARRVPTRSVWDRLELRPG